ncbi:penicillin-binding protein 2 [Candidatus Dojkabacteria bacterium]|uniref:Penicillin-binding protein 2 n=1 Tax=Candidatus Dojkabacteria bacterium TaxID=2099670 RepID=A0A955L7I5_9BACT|nr:penicillin-binding protein 2 [Candidatus Dojkabacteria bacterium]
MTTRQNSKFKSLQRIVFLCFFIIFGSIVWFLTRWQILSNDSFVGYAAERYSQESLTSNRGEILSRHGETLAYSDPAWDVYVYIPDLENVERATESRPPIQTRNEFEQKVSTILGISEQELSDNLNLGPQWVKIADKVPYDTYLNLQTIETDRYGDEHYLSGLNFEFTSKRVYPEGNIAPHVLGFIGKDLNSNDIGRGGIEQRYNGMLAAQEGFTAQETDKFGNPIAFSESKYIRAKRGSTLKTTIDITLQEIVQKKLCEGVEQYEAKSGSLIIMDPKTGEILAMANCPDYDPNEYFTIEDADVFTNKAVVVPYEVGSIAKLFTLSAAVEELNVTPDEIISEGHTGCRMIRASNFDEYDVRQICTADKKPQGALTATQALIKSDNLAFINLSDRLGKETMYYYLDGFGVGKPSGIDLSGESIGYLPSLDDPNAWHPIDMAVFAYGHGYQMNLMQATRGIGAIANRGWVMRPYIISEIYDSEEGVKRFEPLAENKVVSDSTTKTVTLMMEELYKQHVETQYRHLLDYPVATKSGTALIPFKDKVGYSSEINATYVGFDTSNDKNFIMAIRLEAPQSVKKLSYYSARPLWIETYDAIKDHFGIKPRTQN